MPSRSILDEVKYMKNNSLPSTSAGAIKGTGREVDIAPITSYLSRFTLTVMIFALKLLI